MPAPSSDVAIARLPMVAALLLGLAAGAAAGPIVPPPQSLVSQPRTSAERAFVAWRQARGIDPSRAPIPRVLANRSEPTHEVRAGGNRDDVYWQAGFGLPAPDGHISVLVLHEGLLIAGGTFKRIGDLEATGVATWNGTRWSRLGDFPGDHVLEIAPYAGGLVALDYWQAVWRWDGVEWSRLGVVPWWAYSFNDMAVLDDRVAISAIVYESGTWASRVLLHDGTDWTTLGGTFDDGVFALAWHGGELYAGGRFDSLDATPLPLVARWDGSAWRPAREGMPPDLPYDEVRDLTVFNGELVAGGSFRGNGDPAIEPHYLARWNGTRWSPMGPGAPSYPNIMRLRALGTDLYLLGHFISDHAYGIARWDGATWHTDEDRLQLFVHDVAMYQDELYAGGLISLDGLHPAPRFVRRRGGLWRPTLTPGPSMKGLMGWDGPSARALAPADAGIAAVGRIDLAGAPGEWVRCEGAARWDGARWQPMGTQPWNYFEPSALLWHDGALHASGFFSRPGEYGSVVRFDGSEWRPIGGDGQPSNPAAMASAFGHLFVTTSVSYPSIGVARWDGTRWSTMLGEGSFISAMTVHEGELIAAGEFHEMEGVAFRNIAAWSPAGGWRALGDGLEGMITDLTSRNGVLYASGWFSSAGSGTVARWKDGRWEMLPRVPAGWASWTLGWYRNRLVVSSDGPVSIATLEPDSTWRPLGSGVDGVPLSFLERGPSLFVGGYFGRAGDKAAYGFAEWREPGGEEVLPTAPRVIGAPNPFAASVSLAYELAVGGRTQVEIYDLTGHLVERVFDGYQGPGPQIVTWRPAAKGVGAGVYFAKVITEQTSQVVRVVRVQ